MPELPQWARQVRLRHLIHHTSGLAQETAEPSAAPGVRFAYSNAGYVLLAEAIGRAAGEPLPGLARRLIFAPLGMADSLFWTGPEPAPPGAAPLDPADPPPLSVGDGGLWSTAADLLRWADGLDRDRLGITGRVQTPGALDDGTPLDLRVGDGRAGAGRAPRIPARRRIRRSAGDAGPRTGEGVDLVILALGDRSERRITLTDRLLAVLLA